MAKYWLMKTEPEVFSFEDLVGAPKRTTHWEGVRNYQARNFLRDGMKLGDKVFIYHSNVDEPAVMGVAEVVREGYPDHFAFEPGSKYYDADARKKGVNPWVMVDVKAIQRMKAPVTRPMMLEKPALKGMLLLKRGTRLSVQPVTAEEWKAICSLGQPQDL